MGPKSSNPPPSIGGSPANLNSAIWGAAAFCRPGSNCGLVGRRVRISFTPAASRERTFGPCSRRSRSGPASGGSLCCLPALPWSMPAAVVQTEQSLQKPASLGNHGNFRRRTRWRRVYWIFHCLILFAVSPSHPPEVCVGRSAHHSYALRSRSRMSDKFVALTAAFVFCASTAVFAQSRPVDQQTNSNPSGSVMQPQGKTGPIVTKRGWRACLQSSR